jgi:deoxyribodipyrimidine photolyase-like uncharacterized protein
MPTENPKISLYVPQHIYDRFMEYKEESGLSMSQAGTVLLAEYFGLEETIKDITEGVTIGGVTLDRVERIEQELKELKEQVNNLVNWYKSTSKPLDDSISSLQGELPLSINHVIVKDIILSSNSLAKRLKQDSVISITNRSRKSEKDFYDWSKSQDPDGIAWTMKKVNGKPYYYPDKSTSSELLGKLEDWMEREGVKSEGKFP